MAPLLQKSDSLINQELLKTMVKNINMKIYGPMSQILETLNVHIFKEGNSRWWILETKQLRLLILLQL